MIERQPILSRTSSPMQILVFLLVIFICLLFTLIIGIVLGIPLFGFSLVDYVQGGLSLNSPEMVPLLKYLQVINTLGLFVFPPLIFGLLVERSFTRYLAMNIKPSFVSSVTGIAVIIAVLPFIQWLAGFNEMMSFPEWLTGLEEWMRNSEDQAKELTELFLATTTAGGLMINLLMIAVLPALGEEFLFRGVLLRLFREWTGNPHVAVVISALLFSALHLQFYGFLPRFFLGILLGYLFVWTRSIWVPVLVHFVNNGIAVAGAWYFAGKGIEKDIESIGEVDQPMVIVLSLMMVLLMLLLIWFYEIKKKGSTMV